MRSKVVLGTLAVLFALAFVVPAGAVTVNGVEYTLYAQCKIGMENGPTVINGNVKVAQDCGQAGGLLQIGAGNTINGIAKATRMFFGTGATVTRCEFDFSTGGSPDAVCGNIPPDPIPPGFTPQVFPPLPVPAAVTPGPTDFICPVNATCSLTPGPFKAIRVSDGATLNLDLSPPVTDAASLLVEHGATLNGFNKAINLTGNFATEPGAFINDVKITTIRAGTIEAIVTGNGTIVTNSVFFAPFARMHLHQNGDFNNFEGVAVLIVVEPITIESPPPPPLVCACPANTHFADTDPDTCVLPAVARVCVPD